MKKTNKITRILSVVISLVLIVAMALSLTACKNNLSDVSSVGNGVADTSSKEAKKVGDGATEFAFRVTDKEGNSTDFIVYTDKKTVGEALFDAELVEGENQQYGLYVKKVNGIVADYDVDQTYWAFYINGEMAMTGVDTTDVEAGATYSFKVEK